jgi:hypothetical protein
VSAETIWIWRDLFSVSYSTILPVATRLYSIKW